MDNDNNTTKDLQPSDSDNFKKKITEEFYQNLMNTAKPRKKAGKGSAEKKDEKLEEDQEN